MNIYEAAALMVGEHREATEKFPTFNSAHEGYAILKEELDELWDAIKDKKSKPEDIQREAIQVGAMAMRFILDVCGEVK